MCTAASGILRDSRARLRRRAGLEALPAISALNSSVFDCRQLLATIALADRSAQVLDSWWMLGASMAGGILHRWTSVVRPCVKPKGGAVRSSVAAEVAATEPIFAPRSVRIQNESGGARSAVRWPRRGKRS